MSRSLPSQTIGPFYSFALTSNADLGRMARDGAKGERIRIRFRMLDGDEAPVPDGMIEIWQADASGKYDHPADTSAQTPDAFFCGFGRMETDDGGWCCFETVYPGRVPDGQGGWQAPHLNVSVFARGLLGRLCTRVYFEGDNGLAQDAALNLVPSDRRHTLLARRSAADASQWEFTVRLQGDEETVFFDI